MSRVAVCLLALLIAGCSKSEPPPASEAPGPAPAAPREIVETEPNDTPATATPVAGEARITAQLGSEPGKNDEDLFRLAASPSKVATFEVSGIPGVDVRLDLLDIDGNPIASFNSEPACAGEKLVGLNLDTEWIVRVAPVKRGSGGAYTASVSLADAPEGHEVEPNDRAVDATPLPLDVAIEGRLADKADEDWYRIEVPLPVPPAEATAADEPAGLKPAAGREPAAELTWARFPAVAATEPAAGEPGAQWAHRAEPADPVPRGEAPSAGVIEKPAEPDEIIGPIEPEPPPVAVVKLEISGVPDVRLQVEVANEAQAVFYTARSREIGEGIQVRNLALRPGETTYFVTVKSAWVGLGKEARRGHNQVDTYALSISPEEAGANAELEPNDEPARATPFVGDGTRQGFLAPKGDVDYFRVSASEPSLLKIELSGLDRVDSTLSLVSVDEAGKEQLLLRADDGGVREGELLVNVAAGPDSDVLVKVDTASRRIQGKWVKDQENAIQPYRLTVSSRPDDGTWEREPNGDGSAATPIEVGRPMRGHVHPKKDVDLYRLDLTRALVKVPLRINLTGILKVDLALKLYRLDAEGKPTLVQSSEKGKGDQPESIRYAAEPGVYLIEVKDTPNRQSNFIDAYQLLVEQE
jgi:hypothetical protein